MVTHFVKRLIKTEKSIVLSMRAYIIRATFMLQQAKCTSLVTTYFYQIQLISDIHWQRIRDVAIIMSSRHFCILVTLSSVISSGQEGSSTSVVMTIVKSFLEHLSGRYYLRSIQESKRQVDECSLIHVYQEQ